MRRYTDQELAEAYKLYAEEKIRGATPRYWEDVKEGEALPTMVKGPMTVTGFIAYAQGWGGLYIRANKLAWKLQDAHPGLGIKNRFGIPDCPERVHWEEEFAHEVGAPGAYDYGPERASWLTHHMTNWMGDDGVLRNATCKIRRHNPAGDILFIKGKVTRKYVEDGRHLVAIEQEARQQDDELSILGTGIVELPSKGKQVRSKQARERNSDTRGLRVVRAAAGVAGRSAELSDKAGAPDRALPGGAGDRRCRPLLQRAAEQGAGPAVRGRQPARRRRQHRHRGGRPRAARRLHAADGHQRAPRP